MRSTTFLATQKNLMVLGAALTVCGQAAMADVVWDNGMPDLGNAFHSDVDTSAPASSTILGDDFSFAGSTNLNSFTFYGIYASNGVPVATDNFTVAIYDNSGPVPSTTALHSFNVGNDVNRADTGTTTFGLSIYSYTADIATLNLAGGDYLLSVYNNTAGDAVDWYWATANSVVGNTWDQDTVGGDWTGGLIRVEMAFSIGYTVPAPGSLAVLSLGLVGIRRRR